ncbi:MAG: Zn-ribbon domain-containing OB-fold protein [Deltaproteobacteria bacterium]|nr:Zn-ribbon domain-containing OB-fold protein [Deltaproteobacteria bacterium]MBW1943010.1 Zn-ribbon domain-containing OB-fold protein [Deltaproteobacteria bacterium]MBW2206340.1 Zn-ribbon domain-containing OB-fold protein [Deltaproteobacteria bacterium]
MGDRSFSDISYNQFLQEEKLMGSRCKECGALFVPPRSICIQCYSADMEWVEMTGKGSLAAFTCISIGPPSMIAEGYNRKNPYCSGVVALDEGAKVDARIEGVDTLKPETIKVGMPMAVKFLHRDGAEGSKTYLAFEPA